MTENPLSLEHIDPRNGVLVSGLENEFNEVIAELSYNSRKTNRFVPYRVCSYPAPINEGDIGEFLIGGEWVVCAFMVAHGVWWEESNRIGNGAVEGGKKSAKDMNDHPNTGRNRSENGRKVMTQEVASEFGKRTGVENGKKTGANNGRKSSKPVLCVETGVTYPSVREAGRTSGVSSTNIRKSIRLGHRAGGYHWQFVEAE
jgi:hypothetical protein